jgi:uncharacterized RDD family membrane protein YckC
MVEPVGRYSPFWKRVVAFLIDIAILIVAGSIIGGIIGRLAVSEVFIERVSYYTGVLLNWLYFTLFESSSRQATPGKMVLGLTVVDYEGNRISLLRANGRWLSKILSAGILLIGFLMAAFTERKQALHDILARTLVADK